MKSSLDYPFDYAVIQRKKRSLKKELENSSQNLTTKKIAILGGSTTNEVQNILELFLLKNGIKPVFYQSEYNKYYEDIILSNPSLDQFQPDIIYFHTSSVNITNWPEGGNTPEDIQHKLQSEILKFESMWKNAQEKYNCLIIQNNFELLNSRELGNVDTINYLGKNNFIRNLNNLLSNAAEKINTVLLNDINYLSSLVGLNEWHNAEDYLNYKYAMSHKGIIHLTHNLCSIINTQLGRSKKCLILDLDNTLWGGVIGDDGVQGISLGNETAQGEAFLKFQKYVKSLKDRGVILAVCSKNDLANAKKGFDHPDSILKVTDFTEFVANWENKDFNIINIAKKLNIGIDSMVFVDDNPAERELVSRQIPDLTVVDFGESILNLLQVLDQSLFFDTNNISKDDLARNAYYQDNKSRQEFVSEFANYNDYLLSLEMEAEVSGFTDLYIDRIAQLTNKTNQFNLTGKRYTTAEIKTLSAPESYISFCARLKDRFGDNGVVTIFSGKITASTLEVDLWLMSCRVFKRTLENSVFDVLVQKCKEKGIKQIVGHYFPTSKNTIVESLYSDMGFKHIETIPEKSSKWVYEIADYKKDLNPFIKIKEQEND